MSGVQIVFAILALLGAGGGGFGAWFLIARQRRKLGADTSKVEVDTAVEIVGAGDKRLLDMLKVQTESIVDPLVTEVSGLRGELEKVRKEVDSLRTELGSLRTRYWRSITHIRDLYAWIAKHLPNADPPPPVIPADIAQDV